MACWKPIKSRSIPPSPTFPMAAVSIERMADQVNNKVAESREGGRNFTTTGLYEFNGLAKDAQRMVGQITRVADMLERDPGRFFFGDQNHGVRAE